MNLKDYIRDIPDFPKPGILFKDITPLLGNPGAFQYAIDQLAEIFQGQSIDSIAAAEARGFLVAAPLSLKLQLPMIPLRKPGKLPYRTYSLKYDLEYGSAELHMHIDSVELGHRVLLVDDLLATGGTMKAAAGLIDQAGGTVVAAAFLVELLFLQGREKIHPIPVEALIQY
jgi:adenine phosphoribosyltransferase